MNLDQPQPLHRLQRGRTVQEADNSIYILLKDGQEIERLNVLHTLIKKSLGHNFFAPIKHPRQVLDVACGTGIWAREMARYWQQARVEGFDLDADPITLAHARIHDWPRNFHFQAADALQPWPYERAIFNYVHARFCAAFIPLPRWPEVVAEMARVTTPGGWVELTESAFPTSKSVAFGELREAAMAFVMDRLQALEAPQHLGTWLEQAGLVQVHQEDRALLPTEPAIAQALNAGTITVLRGMQAPLLAEHYISEPRWTQLMERLPAELEAQPVRTMLSIAYGRKPHLSAATH